MIIRSVEVKDAEKILEYTKMEKDVPEVWIRSLDKKEYSIIKEFLYHAIYVPEGSKKPNKSIVDNKELLKYYEDFGRKDDYTMAAVINNRVIGLAWCRQFNETDKSYGFYKDDFVELNISILPDFRKQGLGKVLMEQLIYLLKNNNVNGISLSVTNGNYAQQLYKNIGFKPIAVRDEDTLMIKEL
ncbi:N-acetyltransferase family protein [Macrococcoides goetzii]|uniref:GNAT family N-acetyltransferase n=1 Tax=Macrococcus TaxID=69965 RepID=UPI001EF1D6BB|nr:MULTISPECIES: GNAT family N-acetyltransferase [Macrococcus]MCG7421190.1 GNAT family N-acetyltransferase [Macrococcus epidermidis]MCH4986237.1 GNAT family N-acetyltransferase [Macrococcus sp. PK]